MELELSKEFTKKNEKAAYNLKSWAMKAMDEKISGAERRTKQDIGKVRREVKVMMDVPGIIGDACLHRDFEAYITRQVDFNASCKDQLDLFKESLATQDGKFTDFDDRMKQFTASLQEFG